jgi:hypothetical protein
MWSHVSCSVCVAACGSGGQHVCSAVRTSARVTEWVRTSMKLDTDDCIVQHHAMSRAVRGKAMYVCEACFPSPPARIHQQEFLVPSRVLVTTGFAAVTSLQLGCHRL